MFTLHLLHIQQYPPGLSPQALGYSLQVKVSQTLSLTSVEVRSGHLPDSLGELLGVEPLVFLPDHHQPLLHPTHLLLQHLLLPGRPTLRLWEALVVDEAEPVLHVVDLVLGVLPLVDLRPLLPAQIIALNYAPSLLPIEMIIIIMLLLL